MHPLLMLAEARDALTGAVVTVVVSLVLAGLVGLVRWLSSATRREGASEVTTSQLATTLARIEARLDTLASGHAEGREARVRIDAELAAVREHVAAVVARLDGIDARVTRVDEQHTTARHALRGEIQGWVSTGIGDALDILRALIPGGNSAARPARGGR
jgi:hypothetical protein